MDENNINVCIYCFEKKTKAKICPNCGWPEIKGMETGIYLPPGTVLNHKYIIGRVLGHGGFGITYLGWDLNLQVKLAVKEYLPRDMATRTQNDYSVMAYTGPSKEQFEYGLDKFLNEARILAKFEDFPGIVSVRDFFKENGTAYFIMSFVEGITFKEYLEQNSGKLSFERALEILMPVFDALKEVHRSNLLHRDVSPDNIFITKDGRVKILDFGAARYASGEHSRSLSIILKPGYAPEEQYRSKGKQGPWTDVYSLCATLYRAITGITPPESLDRMADETLILPSEQGINISSTSESAMLKALSLRAKDRFQTIDKFQDAISGQVIENDNIKEKYQHYIKQVFIQKEKSSIVNSIGMNFVYIKPGTFMMGSPTNESGRSIEERQHQVTLTKGFYMQTTEVTKGQWYKVMNSRPWSGKKCVLNDDNSPAVYISWNDCQTFIQKLNNKSGKRYQLPTEAQWEYVARSGTTTAYNFGNNSGKLGNYAWFRKNTWDIDNKYAHKVAQKQANKWGLYDMHGNVYEWCQDRYGEYPSGSVTDPRGSSSGSFRILRGGSWDYYTRYCRSAYRLNYTPGSRYYDLGFRLVLSPC